MQQVAAFLLVFLVFPLWVVAGFADWACHRQTDIAHTSGLKENLLHLTMFTQLGLGIAAVALLEVNAAVLSLIAAIFVVHELTVYWDLHYSTPRRRVGPFEQMVHSFMEILPLASIALIAVLAWEQALALAGLAAQGADWSLRPKERPLPVSWLVTGFLASLVLNALPLAQETWSCVRARIPANPGPR